VFLRNLDGTLALMGHLLLPTASEAKREGGPTITYKDLFFIFLEKGGESKIELKLYLTSCPC
jgi:hypothetical protein